MLAGVEEPEDGWLASASEVVSTVCAPSERTAAVD
jgi:hypothetical protein